MAVVNMVFEQEILEVMSENLHIWREKYGVLRIGLVGSYSRGEQKSTSDIDIVVEFNVDALNFDNYMELKFNLEDRFQKPVDLVILDDLKPEIKISVLKDIKYAQGA